VNTTQQLLRQASKGLEGKHPLHDFPVGNGTDMAAAHAVVALATEQQTTNAHLASIADSLTRIADAMNQTALPPEPEPKRRLWLPGRRTA
jgi:hypothetical protein